MKLSLSDLKKLYADKVNRPVRLHVEGHVDLVVRNSDGSVDQAISKPNLAMDSMWNDIYALSWIDTRTQRMFILPDDNCSMNIYRTCGRHVYSNNYEVSVAASFSSTTLTMTWTAVFSQPSGNRTFRYIGMRWNSAAGTQDNGRSSSYIMAMSKLTSNVSQTTSQTLEAVYRVSFSRA